MYFIIGNSTDFDWVSRGCSMTKERYDPYGVVEYLENKYDDEVRYFKSYANTKGKSKESVSMCK